MRVIFISDVKSLKGWLFVTTK